MQRGWLQALAVLAVAALTIAALGVGVEAWAGLYPHSPALERAGAWPIVGRWIAAARERHLGPPAPRQPVPPPIVILVPQPSVQKAPPAGPADLPAGVWPELWLHPGDALRARPAADAPVVIASTAIANVSVLEARGEWRRVRWHGREGWVRERPSAGPPLGSAVEPVRPVSGRPAAPELLDAAREILGDARVGASDVATADGSPSAGDVPPSEVVARKLGPYPLLTDVDEPALLLLLDRAAGAVDAAYRARYGLELAGEPAETVVLFRRRTSYDEFLRRTGGPAAETGHFARGVVALYREGRLIDDVLITLVHELVHALGRRGLGPALPPWLDEGMADDLAESRIGGAAGVAPGTVSGTTLRFGSFFEMHGGEASRELLRRQRERGGLVPLARLVAMDDADFHAVRPAGLGYAEASFFIRFLLAGELQAPFRRYLREVASGVPPTPEALQAALGSPWEDLDAGLAAWIQGGPPSLQGAPWPPTATATPSP